MIEKVIQKGIKYKIDDTKGFWDDLLHEISWAYHTTPHTTTKETPYFMVYRADIMLLVEIDTHSWKHCQFNLEVNNARLKCVTYLVYKLRDVVHIQEFASKHRSFRRHNYKVVL